MTEKEIEEVLATYPLPKAFAATEFQLAEVLAEKYRKAAYLHGAGGNFWKAWFLLTDGATDLEKALAGLSDDELPFFTKWARLSKLPQFEAIFQIHFARQRKIGEYPMEDDTIFYLDLLLKDNRLEQLQKLFEKDYNDARPRRCYWERSRLVLALVAQGKLEDAEIERSALSKVMRKTHAYMVGLDACIAIQRGDPNANALAVASLKKEIDDGLRARLNEFTGNPHTEEGVEEVPEQGGPFWDAVNEMAAASDQLSFEEQMKRMQAAFDAELAEEFRKFQEEEKS